MCACGLLPTMAPGPEGHLNAPLALSLTHVTKVNPLVPSGTLSFLLYKMGGKSNRAKKSITKCGGLEFQFLALALT